MKQKQQITELLVPKIKVNIPIYPLGTVAKTKDKIRIKINKICIILDCIENKLVSIDYYGQNREESFEPEDLIFPENIVKTCLEFQVPKFSSCKILTKKRNK